MLAVLILFTAQVFAQNDDSFIPRTNPFETTRTFNSEPFYGLKPFTPQRRDYSLDLGSMWETTNLYWLGGSLGFHTGKCIFSDSETCQNYFDLLGGVGGRDGFTDGMAAVGYRWQFIGFPKPYSPFARVFVGAMRYRDDVRNFMRSMAGVSYGITVSVHDRMDLKLEARYGVSDQAFGQLFFSIGFRADKWIEFVGQRLKGVGKGALDVTSTVLDKGYQATKSGIKATGEATGVIKKEETKP